MKTVSAYRKKTKEQLIKDVLTLEEQNTRLERNLSKAAKSCKEFRMSHANFSALLKSTDECILICDRDSRTIAFNASYARSMKEAVGADIKLGLAPQELFLSESAKQWLDEQHGRVIKGEAFRTEYPFRFSKNIIRHYEFSFTPIYERGKVVGFCEVSRDITEHKMTEEALNQSRERIMKLIEYSPLPMAVIDNKENITFLNKKFQETFGYTLGDIPTVKQWWPLAYPDDAYRERMAAKWLKYLKKAKTGMKEFRPSEYEVTCKDGRVLTMEMHGAHIGDDNFIIFSDVTEHIRMEQMLRRKNAERQRLTTILESTSDFVSTSTPDARLTYMNSAGRRLLGLENGANMRNMRIQDTHPDWAFEIVRDEGVPAAIRDGIWTGDTAVLNSRGEEIPVSQVIMSHKSPEGELEYLSTIIRDISTRKRIEGALRESEKRFREITELLPETVFEITTTGTCTYANRMALESTGHTQEDLEGGINVFELIAPEDRERVMANARKSLGDTKIVDNEYTMLRKDGSRFPVLIHSSPIMRGGRAVGLRGIAVDITERKKFEDDLQRYTKKVEDYAIELELTQERLLDANFETILMMTRASEHRDEETGGHIKRIGHYAAKLAVEMDMDIEFCETIMNASLMHDIGKIGIPDYLLYKKTPFSEDEYEFMKKHTEIGYNMLKDGKSKVMKMACEIAHCHHERWDGTGYPRGFEGLGIPFTARVVMLADQYDALRSNRPYRGSLSHDETMHILTEGDGRTMPSHFCPEVLSTFIRINSAFEEIYIKIHNDDFSLN